MIQYSLINKIDCFSFDPVKNKINCIKSRYAPPASSSSFSTIYSCLACDSGVLLLKNTQQPQPETFNFTPFPDSDPCFFVESYTPDNINFFFYTAKSRKVEVWSANSSSLLQTIHQSSKVLSISRIGQTLFVLTEEYLARYNIGGVVSFLDMIKLTQGQNKVLGISSTQAVFSNTNSVINIVDFSLGTVKNYTYKGMFPNEFLLVNNVIFATDKNGLFFRKVADIDSLTLSQSEYILKSSDLNCGQVEFIGNLSSYINQFLFFSTGNGFCLFDTVFLSPSAFFKNEDFSGKKLIYTSFCYENRLNLLAIDEKYNLSLVIAPSYSLECFSGLPATTQPIFRDNFGNIKFSVTLDQSFVGNGTVTVLDENLLPLQFYTIVGGVVGPNQQFSSGTKICYFDELTIGGKFFYIQCEFDADTFVYITKSENGA